MSELPSDGVAECLLGGAEDDAAVLAKPLRFLSLLSLSRAPPTDELNNELAGNEFMVAKRDPLFPLPIDSSELRSVADDRSVTGSVSKGQKAEPHHEIR